MIDQDFINKYQAPDTATAPVMVRNGTSQDFAKALQTLQDKHCTVSNNHRNHLFSFVSAARAIGIDKHTVEKYIANNIHIATDSSQADAKNLQSMINDNYNRYSAGIFANDNYVERRRTKNTMPFRKEYDGEDDNLIFKKYNQYRITSKSSYPVPDPIISINGESVATEGNVMSISGIQKSGKSSLCNMILSGSVSKTIDGIPDELKIVPANGKAIIHIDTEQAEHRHQYNIKNILKRGKLLEEPDCFYSYNVRGMESEEAITMLTDLMFAAHKKHGGIHLVLIDGIADFITSVNDEEQSIAIVKHMGKLVKQYATLIIVVIHRNPNDNKVRGHLGSELLRKSETVLAMKKDGDSCYIDPEELRTAAKGDIPKYLFAYNKEKGYHCFTGVATTAKANQEEQLLEFVQHLESEKEYSSNELVAQLCDMLSVKEERAKQLLSKLGKSQDLLNVKKGFWKKNETNPFEENDELPFSAITEEAPF